MSTGQFTLTDFSILSIMFSLGNNINPARRIAVDLTRYARSPHLAFSLFCSSFRDPQKFPGPAIFTRVERLERYVPGSLRITSSQRVRLLACLARAALTKPL